MPNCGWDKSISFLKESITVIPSGFIDYRIHFVVDRFPFETSVIWLNLVVLVFIGFVFFMIYKIQRKLTEDILIPIQGGFLEDRDFKISQLSEIRKKLKEHQSSKEKQAVAGAILEHNYSIGHNVKSIQQTLEMLKSGEFSCEKQKSRIDNLSKEIRSIMSKVAENIPENDKAKLITSNETFFDYLKEVNQRKTKANINSLFEISVDHKELEYKDRGSLPQIDLQISNNLKNKYVEIVGPEFRAILSNLMNNSIEAGANKINIEVSIDGEKMLCRLEDNGSGVNDEIAGKLFDRGFTTGKDNGTGYGLFHGKMLIESWGGSLRLAKNKPTVFEINLPLWKPLKLDFHLKKKVIILDDEKLVRQKWKAKISKESPIFHR